MAVLLGDNAVSVSTAVPNAYSGALNTFQFHKDEYVAVGGAMAMAYVEVVAQAANIKIVVKDSAGVHVATSAEIDCTAGGVVSGAISGTLTGSAGYRLGYITSVANVVIHRTNAGTYLCKEASDLYATPSDITIPPGNANRGAPRVWIESAAGATISAPADAVLGSTLTIALTNGSATQGAATVDINGNALTIVSYPAGGNGNIVCDVDCIGLYDPTAVLTYTDNDASTDTASINFKQQAGYDAITLVSPLATDDGYVLWGTIGYAAGDQLETEIIANLTVAADSEIIFAIPPAVTVTMTWYLIDATDGIRTGPFVATYNVATLAAIPVPDQSNILLFFK